jgi:hypothetical protein
MDVFSPSLLHICDKFGCGLHQLLSAFLGVDIRITAAQLEDGLKWGGTAAGIHLGHGLASLWVTVLGVSVILGPLALSV